MNAARTSVSAAGLGRKRPRCGRGLKGLPEVRERREIRCLSNHDAGDGPAVFVVFLVGAVAAGLGLEIAFAPPAWVPVIAALSVALLRPFKGVLMACRNARE